MSSLSANVDDSGDCCGVAALIVDDGPLLGGDGVDARTNRWSGTANVGAHGSLGTEDARVGGVKPGLGRRNHARQEAGVDRFTNGSCDVIKCVELVSGKAILHQLY